MIRTNVVIVSLALLVHNRIEAIFFGFPHFFGNATVKERQVYWNVPTFMCHQYGMHFEEVSRDFGILQNQDDRFRGEEVAILYDPGVFPALLKSPNGTLVIRNGGVPQEGNLTRHLEVFSEHLVEQITDANFRGLGIIDFESWRPIYRQNWASLAPYRDLSLKIAAERHPLWDKKAQQRDAVREFERWGRVFMEETLKAATALRPQATWGYYAYPYCFNLTPQQLSSRCDPKVLDENDKMSWLFKAQSILLPSVYLRMSLTDSEKMGLINGRVTEAVRISGKSRPRTKVLAYFWYKYQDQRDVFLSREDVVHGFHQILDAGADGYVIWGSSNDLNSRAKCQKFRDYLNEILGPAVVDSREMAKQRVVPDVEDHVPEAESPVETNGTIPDDAPREIRPLAISVA